MDYSNVTQSNYNQHLNCIQDANYVDFVLEERETLLTPLVVNSNQYVNTNWHNPETEISNEKSVITATYFNTSNISNKHTQDCLQTSPELFVDKPEMKKARKCARKETTVRKSNRNRSRTFIREQKRLKDSGEPYIGKNGSVNSAKDLRPVKCKCRYKCLEKFGEDERRTIHQQYWHLGSYEKQREFLCRQVKKIPVKNRTSNKEGYKRLRTYKYLLPRKGINTRVCKNFFVNTLDIGAKAATYTKKKLELESVTVIFDKRGKCPPANKTPDNIIYGIKQHIESFPIIHCDYCRKNSNSDKNYLSSKLNATLMFQEYEKLCTEQSVQSAKIHIYREILKSYNLVFHTTSSDMCKIHESHIGPRKVCKLKMPNNIPAQKVKCKDKLKTKIRRKTTAVRKCRKKVVRGASNTEPEISENSSPNNGLKSGQFDKSYEMYTSLSSNKVSTSNSFSDVFDINGVYCLEPDIMIKDKSTNAIPIQNTTETPIQEDDTNKCKSKKALKIERKYLKNLGKEYIGSGGKLMSAKKVHPVDCKCAYKCLKRFSDEERQAIHKQYWQMGSYEKQREFLCLHVVTTEVKQRTIENADESKRQKTYQYYLPKKKSLRQVCRNFFLKTLDIGQKTVIWSKTKLENGILDTVSDKRGKQPPGNKLGDDVIHYIKKHIDSFPKYQSLYTKKEYLSSELNVTLMYEEYKKFCSELKIQPAKSHFYRKIFNSEYDLPFHKPRKDVCKFCITYEISNDEGKSKLDDRKMIHESNKLLSWQEKDADIVNARTKSTFKVFMFDLQTLFSPKSNIYYSRKLCTYNLTILDLQTCEGTCYYWHETDGHRSINEIGTALFIHLKSLPVTIKDVVLYSGYCDSRNNNKYLANLLLYMAQNYNFETIHLKFLEPGHKQMEIHSMHCKIESATKNVPIFYPAEYVTVLKVARKKKPYTVYQLHYNDFINVEQFGMDVLADVSGYSVYWSNVKHIKLHKYYPETLYIKYSYAETNYITIPVKMFKKQSQPMTQKYFSQLPISVSKKDGLLELCKSHAIPTEYHNYYYNLNADHEVEDFLPEPDAADDSEDEYAHSV